MSQTIIPTDVYAAGNLSAKSFTPPAGCILDSSIAGLAGVQASKLQHQYEKTYQQESATNAVTESRVVHVVQGATATLLAFEAGAIVPETGNDTCTIDCLKNGTSILSAAISLTNTDTARQLHTGALTTTTAVAGDVFEVHIVATHNTGTLAKGVFAQLQLREDAQ
jgi:hypothetical protein